MSTNGHKKLRLVKVIVQPFFVLDDGEKLEEKTMQPVQVSAADWENYPQRMVEQIKDTEQELNEGE